MNPSFALHLGQISDNAAFGMVRCEVFPCTMKHGDVVALPVSCADGYAYSREELLYLWTVPNTCDPSTNWISGPDSLWFANWNVNQTTGEVFSEEWYERSSTADSRLAAKSNDGSVLVFTIGQRQKTNMIMAARASYTAISETDIATDKPLTQALIQALNDDAKFSVVNSEVFYLGEYTNGQTVTLPICPVDGYTYSAAECKFIHCWRWTPLGSAYTQPGASVAFYVPGLDQAGPFSASVSSVGVCTIVVNFSSSGGEGETTPAGYGRISVFAFAQRSATPATSPLANNFTELDVGFFFPGESVRASTVLAIKRNIDEAILSPEFFGPTVYHDGDTVPLPTSPVDGYVYKRAEIHPIWSWADTTNNLGGGHVRLPFFLGSVDLTTGLVSLKTWRLPPGGPYVDDCNTVAKISVIVMANRQGSHPELIAAPSATNTPDYAATFVADVTSSVYSVGAFISGFPTSGSQLILRAVLPDAVTFAAGLAPSTATAAAAATASSVFSIQKNGVQFGTITFAASSATGTFAAASVTSFNGTSDVLSIVGPASIDASLSDIGLVLRGTR